MVVPPAQEGPIRPPTPPPTCPRPRPRQGASCAPVYNFVLRKAAEGRQFDAVVALLSAMRASGLEVDPGVAALVRGCRVGWVLGGVPPWVQRSHARLWHALEVATSRGRPAGA